MIIHRPLSLFSDVVRSSSLMADRYWLSSLRPPHAICLLCDCLVAWWAVVAGFPWLVPRYLPAVRPPSRTPASFRSPCACSPPLSSRRAIAQLHSTGLSLAWCPSYRLFVVLCDCSGGAAGLERGLHDNALFW